MLFVDLFGLLVRSILCVFNSDHFVSILLIVFVIINLVIGFMLMFGCFVFVRIGLLCLLGVVCVFVMFVV